MSSLLCSQFKYIVDIECLDSFNLENIASTKEEKYISLWLLFGSLGNLLNVNRVCITLLMSLMSVVEAFYHVLVTCNWYQFGKVI